MYIKESLIQAIQKNTTLEEFKSLTKSCLPFDANEVVLKTNKTYIDFAVDNRRLDILCFLFEECGAKLPEKLKPELLNLAFDEKHLHYGITFAWIRAILIDQSPA